VLLGHACLATTDVALSACLLALAYHFRAGRAAGWRRRVALPALWFGLTFLAKATGLVFGALCLLAVELEWWLRSGALGRTADGRGWLRALGARVGRSARDLGLIAGGGLLLAALYCGNDRDPFRPLE